MCEKIAVQEVESSVKFSDLIAEVALYIESDEARAEVHLPDVSADLCRDLRATYTALLEALKPFVEVLEVLESSGLKIDPELPVRIKRKHLITARTAIAAEEAP